MSCRKGSSIEVHVKANAYSNGCWCHLGHAAMIVQHAKHIKRLPQLACCENQSSVRSEERSMCTFDVASSQELWQVYKRSSPLLLSVSTMVSCTTTFSGQCFVYISLIMASMASCSRLCRSSIYDSKTRMFYSYRCNKLASVRAFNF